MGLYKQGKPYLIDTGSLCRNGASGAWAKKFLSRRLPVGCLHSDWLAQGQKVCSKTQVAPHRHQRLLRQQCPEVAPFVQRLQRSFLLLCQRILSANKKLCSGTRSVNFF